MSRANTAVPLLTHLRQPYQSCKVRREVVGYVNMENRTYNGSFWLAAQCSEADAPAHNAHALLTQQAATACHLGAHTLDEPLSRHHLQPH